MERPVERDAFELLDDLARWHLERQQQRVRPIEELTVCPDDAAQVELFRELEFKTFLQEAEKRLELLRALELDTAFSEVPLSAGFEFFRGEDDQTVLGYSIGSVATASAVVFRVGDMAV